MISCKPGLGFGSALIFRERRRKKGEMYVKARLAIWKGGAFLMPLIAHSPRPAIRLQSKEIAGVGAGAGRELGELEGPRELRNEIDACSVLGLLIEVTAERVGPWAHRRGSACGA